ncbi:MAG: cell envelope integrity protein TolA [Bacteroidota bacterium]|nr:cell envelope integrity protein TolA [Bacteroidota bacterium]
MRQVRNNDLYDFPSEKKKGIIGTLIFHIVLAVILIITGFHTPEPLPEEEGILVNFGTDDTGSGLLEPVTSSAMEESSQAEPEQAAADITQENDDAVMETQAAETQMTQDFEEAPVVEKEVEQPDPEEERRRQEEAEAERLRQQELEEERLRKEAEEAEKRKLEEEQRRRTEIMNRTRDALERANARGTDTSGEGITEGRGNQGVESGVEGAENYREGAGTGTEGISYDLAGRQHRSLPKPSYDIQNEGIVVVEVTVDRNGNVTQAVPGVKGSTTLEEYFLRVAREAAMKAKFDRKPDAPVIQKGTITYHFILK